MWNWFSCYLSGRHEFGVSCEPGAVFLRCIHCGRRSPGWALHEKDKKHVSHQATPTTPVTIPPLRRFDTTRIARGQ